MPSQPALVNPWPSAIDVMPGDTVEITLKLKYKKAEVAKLKDKEFYKYVTVNGLVQMADGNYEILTADPASQFRSGAPADRPNYAAITQDDQQILFTMGIPDWARLENKVCTLHYTFLGDSNPDERSGSAGTDCFKLNIKVREGRGY